MQTILDTILAIPFVSIIINVGFPSWWMLILIVIALSAKNKKRLLLSISIMPLILMVLLYTVTPINGYSRYVIGTTAILPIITTYVLKNSQQKVRK